MIQLKPTNLFAVEVDTQKGHWYDASKFSILGTVTVDKIDFNVTQLFKQVDRPQKGDKWISYPVFGNEKQYAATPQESMYSLLQANGLHFVNPLGAYPSRLAESDGTLQTLDWYRQKWNEAENNLVKNLLILKQI